MYSLFTFIMQVQKVKEGWRHAFTSCTGGLEIQKIKRKRNKNRRRRSRIKILYNNFYFFLLSSFTPTYLERLYLDFKNDSRRN